MCKIKYKKVEVKDIEENSFTCPMCQDTADVKLNVLVNGDYNEVMCISCHNEIANNIFQSNVRGRKRLTTLEKAYKKDSINDDVSWWDV